MRYFFEVWTKPHMLLTAVDEIVMGLEVAVFALGIWLILDRLTPTSKHKRF